MDYFSRLQYLLKMEKEEDRRSYEQSSASLPVSERRASGISWYPVAIRDNELDRADYLSLEVERTTHQDLIHQFRFGMTVALFSNHDPSQHRLEGIITHISGNRMKISFRTEDLPDWSRDGKLGIDAVFDENSYQEMENALKKAISLIEKKEEGKLIRILTGEQKPESHFTPITVNGLNASQQTAVSKILSPGELAIVHGPPGTGKTTTLVAAIKKMMEQEKKTVLVTAPSNAAVDLLTEKLSDEGLTVVRVGNPARVSERLMSLTLDGRMAMHGNMKEMKRLKKQAAEYREMAHKYKRNFGIREREQRKALFAEARSISKELERTEEYIIQDILTRADVIAATLVGANHYSVRHLQYETVVIDEAGQSIEPACWIPILKGKKLIMAGDHFQLPPTIKSVEAARQGLETTLMEKSVSLHPETVVLLEEQYRMHRDIMGFSSREFYQDRLKANASVADRLLFNGDQPLLFVDTAGCGFEEKWEGTSISNPEEAELLIRHLKQLVETLKSVHADNGFPNIAVISPYKHQVEVLKEKLNGDPELSEIISSISINTIDSFQGQERDVVYISMTRSNGENTIGFLSEIRRMNVAMTRAKKKLVVVGDSATLSQFNFYSDFISYAQEKNGYVSAWEV
ncbi:MAG: AAA domain-containing protein [Flavisolibacter sp.]